MCGAKHLIQPRFSSYVRWVPSNDYSWITEGIWHVGYSCHWSWYCHAHCDVTLLGLATQADYQHPLGRCLWHVWMAIALRQCFLVFNANSTCRHSNTVLLGRQKADAPLSWNKDANYSVRLLCRLESFFSLYVHVSWSFYCHNWRRVVAGMFIVRVINNCYFSVL